MQKRIYNLDKIKGVDLTSSPINIARNRASYMMNMISRGGINVKRNGWKTEYVFPGGKNEEINGMYEYQDQMIIHAGPSLYKAPIDRENSSIKYDGISKVNGTLSHGISRGYTQGGLLWIVCSGGLYVYDGADVQTVYDSKYAYIPTTSIGITSEDEGGKRESFQGVNLFSSKRINKLIGAEGNHNVYKLDGKALLTEGTRATVKLNLNCFEEKDVFIPTLDNLSNFVIIEEKNEINTDKVKAMLTGTAFSGSVSESSVTINFINPVRVRGSFLFDVSESYSAGEKPRIVFETDDGPIDTILTSESDGYFCKLLQEKSIKRITLDKYSEITRLVIKGYRRFKSNPKFTIPLVAGNAGASIMTGNVQIPSPNTNEKISVKLDAVLRNEDDFGVLELNFPCTGLIEGESNIEITYIADYEREFFSHASGVVSLGENASILALAYKNVVYFSDYLFGYGYFPDNDYIGVGEENEPVRCIVSLDSYVGVFKEKKLYKVSLGTQTIDEKYIIRLYPSLVGSFDGVGSISERSTVNVNGDTLIFNESGVYGAISSDYKPVNMRSTNVNKELCAIPNDRKSVSRAVNHDGRYYLFIDGRVYIADSRYKYYESERLDTGFEYEWWIWDNCPCQVAYSMLGHIFMGTVYGEIRRFYDGYKDIIEQGATADSLQLMYDGEAFTFSDELYVENGDLVKITGAKIKLNRDATDTYYRSFNKMIDLTLSQRDFERLYPAVISEGLTIQLYDEDYGSLDCSVSSVYTDSYMAKLKLNTGTHASKADYQIVKSSESEELKARQRPDGRWDLVDKLLEKTALVNYGSIGAVLDRDRVVRCELRTGAFDLAPLYAKSLYKISVTPTLDTKGDVMLGYSTGAIIKEIGRRVSRGFDFGNYDFCDFSFDGGFYKSYQRRVFERNFNYIMLRVAHESDGPFGIENAQMVYSINNELRSDN